MIITASVRALRYLYKDGGHNGVSCFEVGHAVWPDRAGRIASASGGGDYAAQMLLGRLKKAGLVEHVNCEGSSRWRLSAKGRREVHEMPDAKADAKAPVAAVIASTGAEPCVCGHAVEEHGHDDAYPGSTSCTECDCIAYESDPTASEVT